MTNAVGFINVVKCVYEIFRPKFYNRVTWVLILSGIGLMSANPLEMIVRAFLDFALNTSFTDAWTPGAGLGLIVIALAYNAFMACVPMWLEHRQAREALAGRRRHDVEVFRRTDEMLDEPSFNDILTWISDDHSCFSEQSRTLDQFHLALAGSTNSYLLQEVETAKEEMLLRVGQVRDFMGFNFYPHNEMCCLYPAGNLDRTAHVSQDDQAHYRELAAALEELVQDARHAYLDYRVAVAHHLYV